MYANSKYTADLAKNIYWRECHVKYPQIHIGDILQQDLLKKTLNKYNTGAEISRLISQKETYYIYIWRVVTFVKELDRIINVFNTTWDTLLILWSGPDEQKLKVQAKSNIHFLGRMDDIDIKSSLLAHSAGLINITKESYGLVTAEAVALWVPVFGYNQWWSVELVTEGKWLLVESKDKEILLSERSNFKNLYA